MHPQLLIQQLIAELHFEKAPPARSWQFNAVKPRKFRYMAILDKPLVKLFVETKTLEFNQQLTSLIAEYLHYSATEAESFSKAEHLSRETTLTSLITNILEDEMRAYSIIDAQEDNEYIEVIAEDDQLIILLSFDSETQFVQICDYLALKKQNLREQQSNTA